MKIAVTGKGGVGKTTLSSTLARLYADEGRTVLVSGRGIQKGPRGTRMGTGLS